MEQTDGAWDRHVLPMGETTSEQTTCQQHVSISIIPYHISYMAINSSACLLWRPSVSVCPSVLVHSLDNSRS